MSPIFAELAFAELKFAIDQNRRHFASKNRDIGLAPNPDKIVLGGFFFEKIVKRGGGGG